jgi:hypothetical protein
MLFLVGGGFAPILLGILATVSATTIGKPLTRWRALLPDKAGALLAGMWPWPLVVSVLLFVMAVETAIFGYPLRWIFQADTTYDFQFALALISVALMLLSIFIGIAHDIQEQPQSGPATA